MLLRSPEMGDLAQQFGASMRFNPSMPRKLNEMAIIITARHWTAQYEWYAHKRAALQAGLESGDRRRDRSRAGGPAAHADGRKGGLQVLHRAAQHQAGQRRDVQAAAKNAFGERGVVDLIGVIGLVPDGVDAAERRSLSVARGRAAGAEAAVVIRVVLERSSCPIRSAQDVVDRLDQLVRIDRLRQVLLKADRQRFVAIGHGGVGGDRNRRHRRIAGVECARTRRMNE